jgi:hypothetical protein
MGRVYNISNSDALGHPVKNVNLQWQADVARFQPNVMTVSWHVRHNARGKLRTVNLDVHCMTEDVR